MDSSLNCSLGREYSPFAAFTFFGGPQVGDELISALDESNPDALGQDQCGSDEKEQEWAHEAMQGRFINECRGGRRAIPDVGVACGDAGAAAPRFSSGRERR